VLVCYGVHLGAEIALEGQRQASIRIETEPVRWRMPQRGVPGVCEHNMESPILLSRKDLKARGVSYSPAQLYRKVKDGSFPHPVRLGKNRVAWLSSEIDQWIKAIAAARPAQSNSEAA